MTEKLYTTERFNVNRTSFGGIIDNEDFNTNSPNKKRISNQIDAINLQSAIENKINQEKEDEKYKTMTLEELKELKLISSTNGRPTSSMTDEKWQKEFNLRKLFIKPHQKEFTKLKGKYSKESGMWNDETQGTYYGQTNWQEYCSYINDVLRNIRSGQVDYCYYVYQIMELAKFHFNNLKTRYRDGYWEVWLEN